MPLYTYRCLVCNKQKEIIHSMNKPKIPVCCKRTMLRDLAADLPSIAGGEFRGPSYSPQVKAR